MKLFSHRSRTALLALTVSLFTGACGGGSTDNAATETGRIVFVSEEDGFRGVNIINADGTGRVRLTNDGQYDYTRGARFSADGTKIIFESSREDCGGVGCTQPTDWGIKPFPLQIWEMNVDGMGLRQLSSVERRLSRRELSPDRKHTLYTEYVDGAYSLKRSDTDGSNEVTLRQGEKWLYGYQSASYSPSGERIIFTGAEHYFDTEAGYWKDNGEIYTMNADGTDEQRLTNNREQDNEPRFSPDGSRIVFCRSNDIYVMDADGRNQRPVTQDEHGNNSPSFSPDGRQIIYQSTRDTTTQKIGVNPSRVCVVNVDGTNLRYLPDRPMQALPATLVDTVAPGAWMAR